MSTIGAKPSEPAVKYYRPKFSSDDASDAETDLEEKFQDYSTVGTEEARDAYQAKLQECLQTIVSGEDYNRYVIPEAIIKNMKDYPTREKVTPITVKCPTDFDFLYGLYQPMNVVGLSITEPESVFYLHDASDDTMMTPIPKINILETKVKANGKQLMLKVLGSYKKVPNLKDAWELCNSKSFVSETVIVAQLIVEWNKAIHNIDELNAFTLEVKQWAEQNKKQKAVDATDTLRNACFEAPALMPVEEAVAKGFWPSVQVKAGGHLSVDEQKRFGKLFHQMERNYAVLVDNFVISIKGNITALYNYLKQNTWYQNPTNFENLSKKTTGETELKRLIDKAWDQNCRDYLFEGPGVPFTTWSAFLDKFFWNNVRSAKQNFDGDVDEGIKGAAFILAEIEKWGRASIESNAQRNVLNTMLAPDGSGKLRNTLHPQEPMRKPTDIFEEWTKICTTHLSQRVMHAKAIFEYNARMMVYWEPHMEDAGKVAANVRLIEAPPPDNINEFLSQIEASMRESLEKSKETGLMARLDTLHADMISAYSKVMGYSGYNSLPLWGRLTDVDFYMLSPKQLAASNNAKWKEFSQQEACVMPYQFPYDYQFIMGTTFFASIGPKSTVYEESPSSVIEDQRMLLFSPTGTGKSMMYQNIIHMLRNRSGASRDIYVFVTPSTYKQQVESFYAFGGTIDLMTPSSRQAWWTEKNDRTNALRLVTQDKGVRKNVKCRSFFEGDEDPYAKVFKSPDIEAEGGELSSSRVHFIRWDDVALLDPEVFRREEDGPDAEKIKRIYGEDCPLDEAPLMEEIKRSHNPVLVMDEIDDIIMTLNKGGGQTPEELNQERKRIQFGEDKGQDVYKLDGVTTTSAAFWKCAYTKLRGELIRAMADAVHKDNGILSQIRVDPEKRKQAVQASSQRFEAIPTGPGHKEYSIKALEDEESGFEKMRSGLGRRTGWLKKLWRDANLDDSLKDDFKSLGYVQEVAATILRKIEEGPITSYMEDVGEFFVEPQFLEKFGKRDFIPENRAALQQMQNDICLAREEGHILSLLPKLLSVAEAMQERLDQISTSLRAEVFKDLQKNVIEKTDSSCGVIGLTATLGDNATALKLLNMFRKHNECKSEIETAVNALVPKAEETDGLREECNLVRELQYANLSDLKVGDFQKHVQSILRCVNIVCMKKPLMETKAQSDYEYGRLFPRVEGTTVGDIRLASSMVLVPDQPLVPDDDETSSKYKFSDKTWIGTFLKSSAEYITTTLTSELDEDYRAKFGSGSDNRFIKKILIVTKTDVAAKHLLQELTQVTNCDFSPNESTRIILYSGTTADVFKFNENKEFEKYHLLVSDLKSVGRGVDFKNVRTLLKFGFFTKDENIQVDGRINRIGSITSSGLEKKTEGDEDYVFKAKEVSIRFILPRLRPDDAIFDGDLPLEEYEAKFKEGSRAKVNCYFTAYSYLRRYVGNYELLIKELYDHTMTGRLIQTRLEDADIPSKLSP